MNVRNASLVIVSLVLIGTFHFAVVLLSENIQATARYVGGAGPGNFTTIQGAINAASVGDTIFVYSGTYYERITVDKSLSILGEDRNSTVIDGIGGGHVVWETADWVTIAGFNITNSSSGFNGIKLDSVQNCLIHNNTLWKNGFAIHLDGSVNIALADNQISSNEVGLYLTGSVNNTIVSNNISSNTWDAISVATSSNNNQIIENNLSLNFKGIDIQNSVNNSIKDNRIHLNSQEGLRLGLSSDFNEIANNSVSENSYGVYLTSSSGNMISQNTVFNNEYGVLIYLSSANNTVSRNEVSNNMRDGISIWQSPNNSVTRNNLTNNVWGLRLRSVSDSMIEDNIVSFNQDGIYLDLSDNNTLVSNNVILNGAYGVFLDSSHNNTFHNNSFIDNGQGISVYSSNDNSIYYNVLDNNSLQAFDDGFNLWDNGYPSGGNHWSDYLGVDEKSGINQDQLGYDGIGDTPYYIEGDANRDRYPLMHPFGLPPPYAPYAPRNLQATWENQEVTLDWDEPAFDGGSPITDYRVYRGNSSGEETFLLDIGNILIFTDTDVTTEQTYYYMVSAINAVGEGAKSNEANATSNPSSTNDPPSCIVTAPDLGATVSDALVITGSSSDSDGIVQYVEIRIDDGTWTQVSGTSSWSYDWDTTSLSNGEHIIQARSFDGTDHSAEVNVTVNVDNTGPPPHEGPDLGLLWIMLASALVTLTAVLLAAFIFIKNRRRESDTEEPPGISADKDSENRD